MKVNTRVTRDHYHGEVRHPLRHGKRQRPASRRRMPRCRLGPKANGARGTGNEARKTPEPLTAERDRGL